jgi:general secretion pathway protein L
MDMASLKTRFKFATPQWHRLANFWSWWIAELGGILPKSVHAAILPSVERLYLELNGPEVIASRGTSETCHKVGCYPLTASALTPEQAQEMKDLASRTREVLLCLPTDKVLIKALTLPLAAEENLREVLGFEMDRQTPFNLDQVYYDYTLAARKPKNNTLVLDLVVTPKLFLDDLLSKLNGVGFKPHQATICRGEARQPLPVNLLPAEDRQRRPGSARHLNLALGVLALALLLGTVALPLLNKLHVIHALEAKVELAAGKAELARRLREEVEHLGTGSRFLLEKKQATPLVIEIVNELTHVLPDDTWINRLDIKGEQVQIQGQSSSAAALIPLIESSDNLHNPRFRSPVTKMPRSNTERFHLSMEVATEPAS